MGILYMSLPLAGEDVEMTLLACAWLIRFSLGMLYHLVGSSSPTSFHAFTARRCLLLSGRTLKASIQLMLSPWMDMFHPSQTTQTLMRLYVKKGEASWWIGHISFDDYLCSYLIRCAMPAP